MRTKEELPECPVATAVSLIGGKWKLIESPGTLFQIAQKQEFPFSANQGYCCCNRELKTDD